ncbi:MAG: addiction module toxin RelE [Candidatus Hydrogenedentes bacterium]|nr:addiction module toxin RelE [Candidatus Hydrogenedentota bacterium]
MVIVTSWRAYELLYAPVVKGHLRVLELKYHSLIRDTIELRLKHHPEIETTNRKPLKRPVFFGATWELRIGPNNRFRVFYKVDRSNHRVAILAIGEKQGQRLILGREEVQL